MASVRVETKDGRLIGILKGSVLHKRVRKSAHLFRKIGVNGSWGIDYEVLMKELPERGSVYITDSEEGILYMVANGKWKEMGEVLHFKEDTVDHYTQVFLPVEYFTRVKVAV